jgi:hypothetical protein
MGTSKNLRYRFLDVLDDRNLASHTYNQDIAEELVKKIIAVYHGAFATFMQTMDSL